MNTGPTDLEIYRRQLTALARGVGGAGLGELHAALADGCPPERLALFAAGGRGKRFEKLEKQLKLVADQFGDFKDLIKRYMASEPLACYDVGYGDADGFLRWLTGLRPLTAEQRDHVTCQRARHALEAEARRRRPEHLRFQELWSVAAALAEDLDENPGLRLHLNPLRVWARLETAALLEGQAEPPQDVLFFARKESVAVAVVEPAAWPLVQQLWAGGPCTLGRLCGPGRSWERDDLVPLCRDLAAVGLVAFV